METQFSSEKIYSGIYYEHSKYTHYEHSGI